LEFDILFLGFFDEPGAAMLIVILTTTEDGICASFLKDL